MGSDSFTRFLLTDMMRFQSTLPGWGATKIRPRLNLIPTYFNPRSPDGERRLRHRNTMVTEKFQSTLPGWGATTPATATATPTGHFNPRSPDGERPPTRLPYECPARHFNPRSPDGERLGDFARYASHANISIHAPRMGSDLTRIFRHSTSTYFNPRSPDGERLFKNAPHGRCGGISIHAPRMGSDVSKSEVPPNVSRISIHAPRMGSDDGLSLKAREYDLFQSTLPGWGAT